jgi:signal transduction histidine kinase
MPPELLAQAIDPFVTTREGRLGIGLARVDTIMDMHGLGWGLRSVPQQGTTVSLEVARPLA